MAIRKKLTAGFLTILLLLCVTGGPALAMSVDLSGTSGQLTVNLRSGSTLVSGGSIALYRVGEAASSGSGVTFSLSATVQPSGVTLSSQTDLESAALANSLATYAQSNDLDSTVAQVSQGTATFSNLSAGLYLVKQETGDSTYSDITPFLVSVPQQVDGVYTYSVSASPKVVLADLGSTDDPGGGGGGGSKHPTTDPDDPGDNNTADPTNPTDPSDPGAAPQDPTDSIVPDPADPEPGGTEDEAPGTDVTPGDTTPSGSAAPSGTASGSTTATADASDPEKLPQTGQLNWPVPLLAVSGILLTAVGWRLFSGAKEAEYED